MFSRPACCSVLELPRDDVSCGTGGRPLAYAIER